MRLLTRLNEYINEDGYEIRILDNVLDISNYIEIREFSSTQIVIIHKNGKTIIEGSNLVIKVMLDSEIKITGNITNIFLRWRYGK